MLQRTIRKALSRPDQERRNFNKDEA